MLWKKRSSIGHYFKPITRRTGYILTADGNAGFPLDERFYRVYIIKQGKLKPAKVKHFKKYIEEK
jgi:hypothetical protein